MIDKKNAITERTAGRRANTIKRGLAAALLVLVATYAAVAGYMYAVQRDLVFRPGGVLDTPQAAGLSGVTAERVALADGTHLLVWTAEPSDPSAPTVLYFHGQGGNLSDRASRYKRIVDQGYGLKAVSYRGYPGSEGRPSEAAFIADGIELFDRLEQSGRAIILYGESLGTGVAAAVAAARPSAAMVVLEAPYTGVADIAAEQYPWLPVHLLIKDPFLTRERIADLKVPLLIVHGTRDRVIPFAHGRALYDLAGLPKRLEVIEEGDHNDLWRRGLWERVQGYWAEVAQQN
ncbi:alpha/beta hydrolase [Roseibium aquae]|uniref:Alpha/beta hydrolase n=1 Tax=Roseibium aquae TaxID=1323746 RepID=A0A916TL10_9HYPH|nr:alpha/beta hydrolase [Roseibium aquae]GGB52524.1 alpha/beta hydrolase [Roseibium aquae]